MFYNLKLRSALLAFLFITILGVAAINYRKASAISTPWLTTSGRYINDPSGNHVILRGVSLVDVGVANTSGRGRTAIQLTDMATNSADGWYARVVRFPVYPNAIDQTPGWIANPDAYYNNHLNPAIQNCVAKQIYCIIDWHYISDYNSSAVDTATRNFWSYIAPKYANTPNVIFELYNEPINPDNWSTWKAAAQPWVDIIRAAAPNNLILIGGPRWSQNVAEAATNPFSGGNIAYVCHIYPQHGGQSTWDSWFGNSSNTVPYFITEWGWQNGGAQPTSGTLSGYGSPFSNYLETKQVSWTAWVFDKYWEPIMFDENWNLLGGENYMGQFTKDELAQHQNDNLPGGGGGATNTPTRTLTSPPVITNTPTRTLTSPPGITNTPTATIVNACTGTGSISRDYWTGVSGTAVSAIPTGNTPSGSDTLASLRAVNWSNSSQNKDWADSYGERLRGYVCVPTSGNYTFWIASDDSSELWLSTDSNSANKQKIASQTDWTNQDEWSKQSTQKSAVIALTGGTSYYIEVLHKEGGGGDNLSVGWAKPGESTSAPSEIVPGSALKPYTAGPTNTPGPSLTPTRTLTPPPVMTNTPTRTNTRTNTPNVTNTRTRTPTTGPSATRTSTPTTGPSATRTATPPPGITNTPTRTNTPPPAMTNTPTTPPVITNTPTQPTGGACTPTSTVTAPFTYDGSGTFCWQIATIPGYVNSWNTTSVSINGTNYTNVWVGAGSLPAKINGNYYVAYNSSVAWGHIEIR